MNSFARLQGRADEADKWSRREKLVTEAFNNRFLTVKRGTSPRPDHILYPDSIYYDNNTVTSNLLPLAFGMVPKEYEDAWTSPGRPTDANGNMSSASRIAPYGNTPIPPSSKDAMACSIASTRGVASVSSM